MANSAQNAPESALKTEDDVRNLEKLIVQLQGLHTEISILAKKAPNDGLNLFKLKLVNNILDKGNAILTGHYKPLEDFATFEESSLPTNSDVTMVLALYIEQAERFRSNNMVYHDYKWKYVVRGAPSQIEGSSPDNDWNGKKMSDEFEDVTTDAAVATYEASTPIFDVDQGDPRAFKEEA